MVAGWQLTVANSKFLIEIELAASCQLTVANSFHIALMIDSSNWQLADSWQFKVLDRNRIGSQLPVASCQFISYTSYGSSFELAAGWQLTVANSKFLIEIELAASCQLTVANSYHIYLMIASSKWHLADSCQFKVLDRNRIGSQLPVDSCKFISYSPYDRFIELAAGWQLTVDNSKFLIEIELAASCQLPVANSFHIPLMVALSNWQLADSWQLPIQSSW